MNKSLDEKGFDYLMFYAQNFQKIKSCIIDLFMVLNICQEYNFDVVLDLSKFLGDSLNQVAY